MEPSRDPEDLSNFIPMKFSVNVPTAAPFGSEGRAQVAINDRPFILQMITHQMIPTVLDANQDVTGWHYQDGLYSLDWSLYEQARFWKGIPLMADAAFGSIKTGIWIPLKAPVALSGNQTLHVIIRNQVARENPFKVHVIWHGIQRAGSRSQIGQ